MATAGVGLNIKDVVDNVKHLGPQAMGIAVVLIDADGCMHIFHAASRGSYSWPLIAGANMLSHILNTKAAEEK
jgi:hypothetical protein